MYCNLITIINQMALQFENFPNSVLQLQKILKDRISHEIEESLSLEKLIRHALCDIQQIEVLLRLEVTESAIISLKNQLQIDKILKKKEGLQAKLQRAREVKDKHSSKLFMLDKSVKALLRKTEPLKQQRIPYYLDLCRYKAKLQTKISNLADYYNIKISNLQQQNYCIKNQIKQLTRNPHKSAMVVHNQLLRKIKSNPDLLELTSFQIIQRTLPEKQEYHKQRMNKLLKENIREFARNSKNQSRSLPHYPIAGNEQKTHSKLNVQLQSKYFNLEAKTSPYTEYYVYRNNKVNQHKIEMKQKKKKNTSSPRTERQFYSPMTLPVNRNLLT